MPTMDRLPRYIYRQTRLVKAIEESVGGGAFNNGNNNIITTIYGTKRLAMEKGWGDRGKALVGSPREEGRAKE